MKRTHFLLICLLSICFNIATAQEHKVDDFTVPTLTPFPVSVSGVRNPVISLNGRWDFGIKGDAGKTQKIQVPGEWEMQGFTVNEGETAVYSRPLEIPSDWKGKPVFIRFDAASSHARVRVNGREVGEHEGSFVPFETEITGALNYTSDRLEVEVQALTISDRLACTSQYACHTVGGLLRKITLFTTAPVCIKGNYTSVVFDPDYRDANLVIRSLVNNHTGLDAKVRLSFSLTDSTGKEVAKTAVSVSLAGLAGADGTAGTRMKIRKPEHWNPEHPYLYTLTTSLLMDGKTVQTIRQKAGFRQIEIRGNRVLVNGSAVKLHGINRHSVYPLTGRSTSPELDRRDAELFREANCNYIRTSHYPPSEEFLNAADELGLFVECEASLCWIQHGASPIWQLWNYLDEKFLPYMVRANTDNITANRNHPSVIIWSLGNESRWSPLWEKVLTVVKQIDPTRPTSFHDQCWGGYNNAQSKADIANYHYPGINGPRAADTMSRPTLFGEYAHLSTYNRRELLTDPGVRSAYAAPLKMFYDSIYHYDGNLGGAIWSGIDDIFHMPDGRIVGYGPWGPLDAWRRPKPEYRGMKKAYSPVRVTGITWPEINRGYFEFIIENRYDFTDLKEVKIEAGIDGILQPVATAIPPHGKGVIKIPCRTDVRTVTISITDPRGFQADEERYEKSEPAAPESQKPVSVTFTENDGAILVYQGDIRYSISKSNGIITGAIKGGIPVLTRGPVFCVVPMNDDNGGKPNVAGETYQNNITPLKNYPLYTLFATGLETKQSIGGIRIAMNLTYTSGKGRQSYLFTTDGKLVTEYEVQYSGQDSIPYQYGLMVELPKYMDKLSWKRNGEFTTYPANDIARIEGVAMLNARHLNGVEEPGILMEGDWKDDANDLGSNDFRSTKRFILEASLSDRADNRIKVISDGKQFSRSWLQDEHIQWLIADYSNAGSEPFYGSPHSDGRISIKNKTLKGKVVITIQ